MSFFFTKFIKAKNFLRRTVPVLPTTPTAIVDEVRLELTRDDIDEFADDDEEVLAGAAVDDVAVAVTACFPFTIACVYEEI